MPSAAQNRNSYPRETVINYGLPSGLTWHAVASTAGINANVNAPSSGLPVYNTQGQLVAASSIYAGSLVSAVDFDEDGFGYGVLNAGVWTGSAPDGSGIQGLTLGGPGAVGEDGFAGDPAGGWIDSGSTHSQLEARQALYALSGPITVPIPEPGGLALLFSALLLFGGFRYFWWRRGA